MAKLDRIKSLVALFLVLLVIVPFTVLGKEHDFTRIAAVFAIMAWLILMFWINRLKKKEDKKKDK